MKVQIPSGFVPILHKYNGSIRKIEIRKDFLRNSPFLIPNSSL